MIISRGILFLLKDFTSPLKREIEEMIFFITGLRIRMLNFFPAGVILEDVLFSLSLRISVRGDSRESEKKQRLYGQYYHFILRMMILFIVLSMIQSSVPS